jgi:formylmethanofuran dehydrogenase subunit E
MKTKDLYKKTNDKTIDIAQIRCTKCNRKLKASRERIGDHKNVVCEHCYQSLVFPYLNYSHDVRLN